MFKNLNPRVHYYLFLIALAFMVYMPLHVFIVQSASLVTGGLDVWKAAKDVLLVVLVPLMLFLAYKRGLFQDKTFRWLMGLGAAFTALHMLFVLFDQNDDTYSAVVASVYNTRLLGYLLLGYLIGSCKNGKQHLKYLLTAAVLVAFVVSLFGIAQYFLPANLLENVGYSLDRGVKPLFFIDDNPDLPRVMSTLKDPNSFGAYLIVPILLSGWALLSQNINKTLFIRPFRREVLGVMLALMLGALFFTFSRGAILALGISIVTILYIVTGQRMIGWIKNHWYIVFPVLLIIPAGTYIARDLAIIQDYVFHAAKTTNQADPNELRVSLQQEAIEDIVDEPFGYGPGTAGLVSTQNPQGGVLTENYYLQIAYEVGWAGLALFVAILAIIVRRLSQIAHSKPAAAVLVASLMGYLLYSLLIHLWSNEAIALQWWLLAGVCLSLSFSRTKTL